MPAVQVEKYNLFEHNCNNFSDEVSRFLLEGKGIPEYILRVRSTLAALEVLRVAGHSLSVQRFASLAHRLAPLLPTSCLPIH